MSSLKNVEILSGLDTSPQNLEAEQTVLGTILLSNEILDEISDINEDFFFNPINKKIYKIISDLMAKGLLANPITLKNFFSNEDELNEIGGSEYLVKLTKFSTSKLQIKYYANLLHDLKIRRNLIDISKETLEESQNKNSEISAEQIIESAEKKLFDIAERGKFNKSYVEFKEALAETIAVASSAYKNEGGIVGVPTGLRDLDDRLGGLHKSDLLIIAGRPSMGKTSLALNIAENVAIDKKLPVAVFSMEMASSQLTTRLIGSVGKVDQHKMRTGQLDDDDWEKLTDALGQLNEAPIHIDEGSALNSYEVRARARRLQRQTGQLGLIVIDYIQLMAAPSGKQGENRATEISEISRSLKALAKELNAPVVVLSQLNRSLEQRPDKRPVMSDLRESGAIEQDADVILFIYRDEVYNPESADKGLAEIIVAKQRNGPIGRVKLTFLGQYTRFENYAGLNYDVGLEE